MWSLCVTENFQFYYWKRCNKKYFFPKDDHRLKVKDRIKVLLSRFPKWVAMAALEQRQNAIIVFNFLSYNLSGKKKRMGRKQCVIFEIFLKFF